MSFTAWLLPLLRDLDHSVVRNLDGSAPIWRDLVRGILALPPTPDRHFGLESTARVFVCTGGVAVEVAQLHLFVSHGSDVVGGRVVRYLMGSGLRVQLAKWLTYASDGDSEPFLGN